MRTIFAISGIFVACLAMIALYATTYFGWLTATPLTEAQLKRAQYDCHVWLFIFIVASIGSVTLIVFSMRYRGRREDRD